MGLPIFAKWSLREQVWLVIREQANCFMFLYWCFFKTVSDCVITCDWRGRFSRVDTASSFSGVFRSCSASSRGVVTRSVELSHSICCVFSLLGYFPSEGSVEEEHHELICVHNISFCVHCRHFLSH